MNNSSSSSNNKNDPLIDPSLLEGLTEEQKQEALAAARAAQRAEERAEQRALERALQQKERQRQRERQQEQLQQQQQQQRSLQSGMNIGAAGSAGSAGSGANSSNGNSQRLQFVSKRQRGKEVLSAPQDDDSAAAKAGSAKNTQVNGSSSTGPLKAKAAATTAATQKNAAAQNNNPTVSASHSSLTKREREAIKETYLGKSQEELEEEEAAKRKKQRTTKKITFKFRWDDTDDTFPEDDPLYAAAPALSGATTTMGKNHHHSSNSKKNKKKTNQHGSAAAARILGDATTASIDTSVDRLLNKPLTQMKARDWRILRENYEIMVKGGKAPPPMRHFHESPDPSSNIPQLHPSLLNAIQHVLRFKEPTPIQRQACSVGLQRRDMIGLAETGSGKTIAFGLPLCHYLLNLPSAVLNRVAETGPLALVMAPTRELALQIDTELTKLLSRQHHVKTCAIVGGQAIQQQAQQLRKGVHIVVGTPGRINDCIEMAYLVLNQCCYIVLDEADRMVDMGFLPQVESILESMGGKLKSENEAEVYQQEQEDLRTGDVATYRITAMFSATMPLEVERIAKQYLRHPAIVSVGDRETGKNTRIVQKLVWVPSAAQKEKALRDQITNPRFLREKVIVFVNEKKHADSVGRMVERAGRSCVVMHGGKSQEHREESLAKFRRGGYVLVCTDVAGRGIDIPDVAHVINFNLPTRSIETYTHRIGRTGRAGKEGVATSFISDEDEGIMPALKNYLQSTGNAVPDRLARHPAASANAEGNLIF